ncbi:MAG: DUF3782 domain-containing protein [Acidobacteriota bacterium]
MSTEVSFEDIKQMFRETDRKFQETDRKFQETDRKFEQTDRKFKETDRKFKETDRKFQETAQRLREVGEQVGGLGNRLGEFVEGVVRPGLVRIFRERGIDVMETHRDLEATRRGLSAQIDILVVNDADVVAVEVKSKLRTEDVDEHIERLGKFRALFPRYADARLLGALAAMVVSDEALAYASRKGMFVIGQRGDAAAILNPEGFKPAEW